MIRTGIKTIVVAAGLLAGLTTLSLGQTADEHSKTGKMSDAAHSHEDMAAKVDKLSTADKANLIDKMPAGDKAAAMKSAAHEAAGMSAQDKADMFDKMPADQKMKMMMAQDSTMHKGHKMGKMGRMHKMEN